MHGRGARSTRQFRVFSGLLPPPPPPPPKQPHGDGSATTEASCIEWSQHWRQLLGEPPLLLDADMVLRAVALPFAEDDDGGFRADPSFAYEGSRHRMARLCSPPGGSACREAVRAVVTSQLTSHGYLRFSGGAAMRQQSEEGRAASGDNAVFRAAQPFFQRPATEKLRWSGRIFYPAPTPIAQSCVCVGYCTQDCAREYFELRRRQAVGVDSGPWQADWWPAQEGEEEGRHQAEEDTTPELLAVSMASATRLEALANATWLLLLDTMVGPAAAAATSERLLRVPPGMQQCKQGASLSCDSSSCSAPAEGATLWRVHRYDPLGCGLDAGPPQRREAQAAHLDLGLLTATTRGSAPGLEVMQRNGSWTMAENHMVSRGEVLIFGGQQLARLSGGRYAPLLHRVRCSPEWCGGEPGETTGSSGRTMSVVAPRMSELLFLRAEGSAVMDPLVALPSCVDWTLFYPRNAAVHVRC